MSLLASHLAPRATHAAVMLAVALHALVLLGLAQYSRTGHAVAVSQTRQQVDQTMTVVFVAQAAPPIPHIAPVASPSPTMRAPLTAQRVLQVPAQTTPGVQVSQAVVAHAAPATATATATAPQTVTSVGAAVHENQPPAASILPQGTSPNLPPEAPLQQAGKPDYAYNPQPDYPLLLREQGVGGVVWLRVWVDSDGHPGEVTLAKGSGYRLLDDAALRAVRQWRFVPAKQGAQSLASWVEFPIRFTLKG